MEKEEIKELEESIENLNKLKDEMWGMFKTLNLEIKHLKEKVNRCIIIDDPKNIEDLNLPSRITNTLYRNGINSVDKLLVLNKQDIYNLHNLGQKGASIVLDRLDKKHLLVRGEK